jgi:hypothetical protein
MLRFEEPEKMDLLVAQPLLFQASPDSRPQQGRIKRLAQVIVGATVDTLYDRLHITQR